MKKNIEVSGFVTVEKLRTRKAGRYLAGYSVWGHVAKFGTKTKAETAAKDCNGQVVKIGTVWAVMMGRETK